MKKVKFTSPILHFHILSSSLKQEYPPVYIYECLFLVLVLPEVGFACREITETDPPPGVINGRLSSGLVVPFWDSV